MSVLNHSAIFAYHVGTIQYDNHRFRRFCVPFNGTIPHVGGLCIDIVSGMTLHEHLDRFCHFYIPFNRSIIGSAVFTHVSSLYGMWLCTMVSNTVTLHEPNHDPNTITLHDPNHDPNSVTLRYLRRRACGSWGSINMG